MKQTINLARSLRRSQTDAEKVLWSRLRAGRLDGVKFRRQQPVRNYIVDFISYGKKLIVEIDGSQHDRIDVIKSDEQRTSWLESQGFKVLRFWDNDILSNLDGVLGRIKENLE